VAAVLSWPWQVEAGDSSRYGPRPGSPGGGRRIRRGQYRHVTYRGVRGTMPLGGLAGGVFGSAAGVRTTLWLSAAERPCPR
jgi:hypothetical protein